MPRVALAPLSLAALSVLTACGSKPPVREPTAREREQIASTARETWAYESEPLPAGSGVHLRRPALQPKIIRVRVSRRDPRYASAVVELRDAEGRRRGTPAVLLLKRDKAYGGWGYPVAGPAVDFPLSCTRATPRAARDLMCPDPWSVLGYPQPDARPQTRFVQPRVDWKKVALPGGACGSTRPIRPLRRAGSEKEAYIHPDVDLLWWNPVWVYSWGRRVFGDLDGDGHDEAALQVVCANGGGTAGGQLRFSSAVFKETDRSLGVVGIVTPRQPLTGTGVHVPLVSVSEMKPGRLIAEEYWYGAQDGDCCASGRARTTWAYRDGRLRPVGTKILRRPG